MCNGGTTTLAQANANPYKYTYAELGGSGVFSGLVNMTVSYWIKLDDVQFSQIPSSDIFTQYHFSYGPNNNNKALTSTFKKFQFFEISENVLRLDINGDGVLSASNTTYIQGVGETDISNAIQFQNLANPYAVWIHIIASVSKDKGLAHINTYNSNTQAITIDQITPRTGSSSDTSFNTATYIFNLGGHNHQNSQSSLCGFLANFKVIFNYAYQNGDTISNYLVSQLRRSQYQTPYFVFQQARNQVQTTSILGDQSGYGRHGVITGATYSNNQLSIGLGNQVKIPNFNFNKHYYSYKQQYDNLDGYQNSFAVSYWINIPITVVEAVVLTYMSSTNQLIFKISHPVTAVSATTFDVKIQISTGTPFLQATAFTGGAWHKIIVQFLSQPLSNTQWGNIFIDNTVYHDLTFATSQVQVENINTASLILGDTSSLNAVTDFYLIQEFAIIVDTLIVTGSLTSLYASNCMQAAFINNNYVCLACNSGFSLQPSTNTCNTGNTCPTNYTYSADTYSCLYMCQPQCVTCDVANAASCFTCSNTRINPPACTCPLGTFDNPQTGDCYTTRQHTIFQSEEIFETLQDGVNGLRTKTAFLTFPTPFTLVPVVSLWTVYIKMYNATTRNDFQVDVVSGSITTAGFSYSIQALQDTQIERISLRYLATTDEANIKQGTAEYSQTGLSSGTSTRTVQTQYTISNWPIYNTNPVVVAYIRDFYMGSTNIGPSCTVVAGSQTITSSTYLDFKIQFQALDSSQISRLRCEYIVIPSYYSSEVETQTLTSAADYLNSQANSKATQFKLLKNFTLTNPVSNINGATPIYGVQFFKILTTGAFQITWNFNVQPKVQTGILETLVQISKDCFLDSYQIMQFYPQETCHPKCTICNHFDKTLSLCQACASLGDANRNSVLPCDCNTGFYEEYITRTCKACDSKCSTCTFNVTQCVTCLANSQRVLPFCECQSGTRSYIPKTQLCGDCSKSYPTITFSNNWDSITIDFAYKVTITKVFDPMVPSQINCQTIFSTNFVKSLGIDYSCYVRSSDSSAIIVNIGTSATVLPTDIIAFTANTVKEPLPCSVYINTLLNNAMTYTGTNPIVVVTLDGPKGTISICQSVYIYVFSIQNDRKRGIINQIWRLTTIVPNDATLLAGINTYLQKYDTLYANSISLPALTLNQNSTFTFQLSYLSNIGVSGTSIYVVQVGVTSGIEVIQNQILRSYYVWETVSLSYSYSVLNCSDLATVKQTADLVKIDWVQSSPTTPNLAQDSSTPSIATIKYTNKNINPYAAFPLTTFQFQLTFTLLLNSNITTTQTIAIQYLQSPLKATILGGLSRVQSFQQELAMNSIIIDPDINPSVNVASFGVTILWTCVDQNTLQQCTDQFGAVLLNGVANQQNFTLQKTMLQQYKTYQFTITGTAGARTISATQSVYTQEQDVPSIQVYVPNGMFQKEINLNDELFFSINKWNTTTTLPNSLIYTAVIIYDSQQVASFPFQFSQIRFRMWDYFSSITYSKSILVKISLRDPKLTQENSTVVALTMNFPPMGCALTVNPNFLSSQSQKVLMTVSGCSDQFTPLLYKFHLYWDQTEYDLEKKFPNQIKRIALNDFSEQSILNITMPQGKVKYNYKYLIMASIMNNNGNIKNITQIITVTESTSPAVGYINNMNTSLISTQQMTLNEKAQQLAILASELSNKQTITENNTNFLQLKKDVLGELFSSINQFSPTSTLDTSLTSSIQQLLSTNFMGNLSSTELNTVMTNSSSFATSLIVNIKAQVFGYRTSEQSVNALKYQGQMIDLLQIYDGVLFSNNQRNKSIVRNRRELVVSDTLNNNVLTAIKNISDGLLLNVFPNDPAKSFSGSSFSMTVQQITDQNLYLYLGTQSQLSINGALSTTQNVYNVIVKTFNQNPYKFSSTFSYPDQTNSFQALDIKLKGSNTLLPLQNSPVSYTYSYPKASTLQQSVPAKDLLQCITVQTSTGNWVNNTCNISITNSTTVLTHYDVTCTCYTLEQTTLVEDIKYVFLPPPVIPTVVNPITNASASSQMSQNKMVDEVISTTPLLWYKFMPFWGWVLVTVVYFYFSHVLYNKDKKSEKIYDATNLKVTISNKFVKEMNGIISPGVSSQDASRKSTAVNLTRHRDQISPYSQKFDIKGDTNGNFKPKNLVTFREFQPEINQLKEIKEEDEISKDESNLQLQDNKSQYSQINKTSQDNSPEKATELEVDNANSILINKSQLDKNQQEDQTINNNQNQNDIENNQQINEFEENNHKDIDVIQAYEDENNNNNNMNNNFNGFNDHQMNMQDDEMNNTNNMPMNSKNTDGDVKHTHYQEDDNFMQNNVTSQKLQELESQIATEINPQKLSQLLKDKEKEKIKLQELEEYNHKFSVVQEKSKKIEFSVGMQIFHIYLEPYHIFDKDISRFIRSTFLYLRLNILLFLTAYMTQTYGIIFIMMVSAVISAALHIPLNLIGFMLRYLVTRLFGYLLIILSFAFIWQQILYMVLALGDDNPSLFIKLTQKKIYLEQADAWSIQFAASIALEIIIVNTVLGVLRYMVFRIALRDNNLFSKLLYQMIDGQKLLTFKEKREN